MKYAIFARPDAGYEYDKQKVKNAGLVVGKKYEIEDADIDRWCSTVKLNGYEPWFNSVHFDFENGEDKNYNFYNDKSFYKCHY